MRNGIPTAGYEEFDSASAAIEYLSTNDGPIVWSSWTAWLQARELWSQEDSPRRQSKLCESCPRAKRVPYNFEEMLVGTEASILCVSDGQNFCTLLPAQDHKRIEIVTPAQTPVAWGAIAPAPAVDISDIGDITEKVFKPAIAGMAKRGISICGCPVCRPYDDRKRGKGAGVQLQNGRSRNSGHTAASETDFAELLWLATNGRLDGHMPEFYDMSSVCLVMSSKGYPGRYDKGIAMELPKLGSFDQSRCVIFHAGTAMKDGKLVTNGGRVLGVTRLSGPPWERQDRRLTTLHEVRASKAYYRSDIGLVK